MLIARMLEPIVIEDEYSSIPKRSKGKPTNISISEKKIENACGSAIIYLIV